MQENHKQKQNMQHDRMKEIATFCLREGELANLQMAIIPTHQALGKFIDLSLRLDRGRKTKGPDDGTVEMTDNRKRIPRHFPCRWRESRHCFTPTFLQSPRGRTNRLRKGYARWKTIDHREGGLIMTKQSEDKIELKVKASFPEIDTRAIKENCARLDHSMPYVVISNSGTMFFPYRDLFEILGQLNEAIIRIRQDGKVADYRKGTGITALKMGKKWVRYRCEWCTKPFMKWDEYHEHWFRCVVSCWATLSDPIDD